MFSIVEYILSKVNEYIPMTKKNILPEKIPSHPIVPVRVSPEEKEAMQAAAAKDGKALGTWLKWLARTRIAETEKTGRMD